MKSKLMTLCMLLLFCACKKATELASPTVANNIKKQITGEQLFPGETGEIKSGEFYGQTLRYQLIHGLKIYQGDVILTDAAASSNIKVYSTGRSRGSTYIWPGGSIPYTIDNGVANNGLTSVVNSAMLTWHQNAPVNFVLRTNETDYVTFIYGNGQPSSSGIGRSGGQQTVSVVNDYGKMLHELGHLIGLWHEQSRADRDNYITVQYQNIDPGSYPQFDTYVQQNQNGYDYQGGLDFESIMMYPYDELSTNGQATIVKNDGTSYTAQRDHLSAGDIAGVTYMYTMPPPPRIITFNITSQLSNNQTTGYSMSDGSVNLASGRIVSSSSSNTIKAGLDPYSNDSPYNQIPTNANSIITVTKTNGTMPGNAFINAGTGAQSGNISGNTITFYGVDLSTGPKTITVTFKP